MMTYEKGATGSYNLVLMNEDWELIALARKSAEKCGAKGLIPDENECMLTAVIPSSIRSTDFQTKKKLYTRMIMNGSATSSANMIMTKFEAGVYWAGPRN